MLAGYVLPELWQVERSGKGIWLPIRSEHQPKDSPTMPVCIRNQIEWSCPSLCRQMREQPKRPLDTLLQPRRDGSSIIVDLKPG